MKKTRLGLLVLLLSLILAAGVYKSDVIPGVNSLQPLVTQALAEDPRNAGIEIKVSSRGGELSLDLVKFSGDKSMADLFRSLLTTAKALKETKFDKVHLKRRGVGKFLLQGSYFATLGEEFGTQNPVYTIRTFPENLRRPNGEQAFQTWTGGLLGVAGKQMEDFNQALKEWIESAD